MRFYIVIILVYLLPSLSTLGQSTQSFKQLIIKTSPQYFIQNTWALEGEYFFTRQQTSASLAFHATRKYNFFGWNEFNGMAVEGQFRKYLSYITVSKQDQFKQYHQGIFIGAFLKSGKYSDSLEDRPWVVDTGEKFMVFFPGMLAGVQWILWDRIAVEMYTGAGLRQVIDAQEGRLSNRGETETLSFYYKGVMPKMGISLGLPF